MKSTGGYNPMKWDCEERDSCWKVNCSPNIEYFANSLPRNLAFTDLDGTTEVNGHFLFLEWKSHDEDIPTGQRIYFERLTQLTTKISVIIVAGNPATMETWKVRYIHDGNLYPWHPCDLEELSERIRRWASNVDIKTSEAAQ